MVELMRTRVRSQVGLNRFFIVLNIINQSINVKSSPRRVNISITTFAELHYCNYS